MSLAARCARMLVGARASYGWHVRSTLREDAEVYEVVSPAGAVAETFTDADAGGWDPCFWLGAPPKVVREALRRHARGRAAREVRRPAPRTPTRPGTSPPPTTRP